MEYRDWIKYRVVMKEECFWGINQGKGIAFIERKNFPGYLSLVKKVNLSLEFVNVLDKKIKSLYGYDILKEVYHLVKPVHEPEIIWL